ncbi:MAG: hypothetical protein ACYSUY_15740, partial [Planctomycetota bacterium]
LRKVLEIIKDDVELALYFYDVLDPGWVELLGKAGEFEELREKETGMIGKYKAHYLKQCAETKAKAVLGIIEKINAQDINIQGTLIRAIVKMPEETAIKGIVMVKKYLDEQENKWWYAIGESAAELMVNLTANHPDKAFEVAETLLDTWVSEEKTFGKDIFAKFSEDEYSKLMMEHYSKVWEANPDKAIGRLVKILNRCLEDLDKEGKEEKGYDASSSFGYSLELGDLNEIDMQHPEIKTILVKGICEAGKVLIDKEPRKVSELLGLLEETNRVIFLRIAMYLLRFVKSGTETERIDKFVGNKEYFKEYNPCWNEHRRLLNDKFHDVSNKAKGKFIDWVKIPKITEERKKEDAEWYKKNKKTLPDFEKWENQAKAEQLYFVRENFKDEYERYKKAAGVKNDSELAPRKMVSEARFVDPKEGTPLSAEEMAEKKVSEVLGYVSNPKNYEVKKKKQDVFRDAASALRATFKGDVKKRYKDYLECDVEEFKELSASFLASFFYGVWDAVREGSFNKQEWILLIGFAFWIVEEKHEDQKYRDCFSEILSVLRDGFGGGKGKLELDEATAKEFWGILKRLIYFPVKNINGKNEERDPMQLMLRQVTGKALELTVLFGLVCKKQFEEHWEKELRAEMTKSWEYVLKSITEPGINCVFGIEFSRIHWLDTQWVEENLELIFKDELWDEVWGTYTSWGRPSPNCFELLIQEQKYLEAVKRIGKLSKFKFGKEPDKGLTEHLMIGYFNEWIGYDHEVLEKFFEKAPAGLRAKAARFLATGFKNVNEKGGNEKKEVAARMKRYWESRLAIMDKEEAVGFMKWLSDSVLDGKETLEFVEKTLIISGGELSERGDSKGFVEGVCKFGKEGNELLALRCLKKAAADKNMHMPWSSIQEPLVNFLEAMVDMTEDVRSAAIEVADAYGRYNPDKFRDVWEKLRKRQAT